MDLFGWLCRAGFCGLVHGVGFRGCLGLALVCGCLLRAVGFGFGVSGLWVVWCWRYRCLVVFDLGTCWVLGCILGWCVGGGNAFLGFGCCALVIGCSCWFVVVGLLFML